MSTKIGINGFGRIGRLGFRAAWDRDDYEIVHVNEVQGGAGLAAHLLEFDTVHGRWELEIETGEDHFSVEGNRVGFSEHSDPAAIDWAGLGVDLVVESSGKFRTPETIQPHFDRGAKKVIV
ncbi:MAG: glyceraldehyde 3-phosphate dehydrogenase NAD-binding domain-containing protein, partial [Verrucomicrobiota bacterium]